MPGDSESNKKALLDQLRIDRSDAPASGARPLKWFLLIALAGGAGFVLWFFEFPPEPGMPSVRTAVAEPAPVSSAGPSVLDATGYVVARRQATVSSKATGKVVEVLIEEGVLVEEGQLLARLDDSIPRAQLELARSQLEAARRYLRELDVQLRQARLDLERTEELAGRQLASQADLDRNRLSVEGLLARFESARQDIVVVFALGLGIPASLAPSRGRAACLLDPAAGRERAAPPARPSCTRWAASNRARPSAARRCSAGWSRTCRFGRPLPASSLPRLPSPAR